MTPRPPADDSAPRSSCREERLVGRSITWLEEIHAFAAAAGAGDLRIYSVSPFLVLLAERDISDPTALALGAYVGAILGQHCEVRPLLTLPPWRRSRVWACARPLGASAAKG